MEKREKNVESRTFNANEFFGGLKRKEMKKMFGASLQEEFDWTYFFDIDKYNEEVKIRHNCTAMIVIRIREEYLWEISTFGLISPFLYTPHTFHYHTIV